MFKALENKNVTFTLDDKSYIISVKNVLLCAVIFGLAISLVSVIFGLILSGVLSLVNIIVSPLFVTYLMAELKDSISPIFIEKLCILSENVTDSEQSESVQS